MAILNKLAWSFFDLVGLVFLTKYLKGFKNLAGKSENNQRNSNYK